MVFSASLQHLLLVLCCLGDSLQASSPPEGNWTVSYEGFEAPVCLNATCSGRCGDPDATYCACDPHCMLLGICCIDYQALCVTNTSFEASDIKQEFLARYDIQQASQCGYDALVGLTNPAVARMVVRCPVSYPSDDQRTLCENITYTNPSVSTMLAVYSASSQTLFKNQYCARCHGATEWTSIDMYVTSNLAMHYTLIDAAKIHGADGVLNLLRDEALREDIFEGSRVKFTFDLLTLPLLPSRWFCQKQIVSPWCEHSDVDKVIEFIDSYRSPITRPIIGCTFCNDIPEVNWHRRKMDCSRQDSIEYNCSQLLINYPTLSEWDESVVVSASGVRYYNEHVFCPKEEIADVMSNTCVEQPCRLRSRRIAGVCHHVFTKAHPLPTPFTRAQLHVALVLSHAQSLEQTSSILFQRFRYKVPIQHDYLPCSLLTDIPIGPPEAYCATLHFDVSVSEIFEVLSHKDQREDFFDLMDKSVTGLSHFAILNFDPREALSCPHGAMAWYDNAFILTEAVFPNFPAFRTMGIVLVVTSQESITHGVEGVALRLVWSVEESGDGSGVAYVRHSVHVGECREETNLATCRTTLLRPEEYTAHTPTDSGRKISPTRKSTETTVLSLSNSYLSLQIPTDHLIFADNGTLALCTLTLKQALEEAAKVKDASARSSPNAGEPLIFALWLQAIPLLLAIYLSSISILLRP